MNDIPEQISEAALEPIPSERTPLVDRPRPKRHQLMSPKVLRWIGAGIALSALIAATVWFAALGRVSVPDLVGITEGVARVELARSDLTIASVERRFDDTPYGTVLAQEPLPGDSVARGTGIALVVSAGTEEFPMPDYIGMGITLAEDQLTQLGLIVRVEVVPSDVPSDTVLETFPAPGATVRTSDVVRIRIAGERKAVQALLPYALSSTTFIIDPAQSLDAEVDIPLEVARRLRSLLEASGARVVVTRSVTETSVSDTVRAQRAQEITGSITAVIGLDAAARPPGGLAVVTLSDVSPASALGRLVQELALTLGEDGRPVLRSTVAASPMLDAVDAPSVRVRLGSHAVREDTALFRDPAWSDTVARAIYRSVGEQFARP